MKKKHNLFKNTDIENLLSDEVLKFIEMDGILSASEIEDYTCMTIKGKVKQVHNTAFYNRNDGRIFTKVRENNAIRQIIAKNEKELYKKLYDFYFGDCKSSMKDLFPHWVKWRTEETAVTTKTVKENTYLWNAYLADNEIASKPLVNLKVKDYISYFRSITKERSLTKKKFNDIKSIMNGILYFAVEKEIIEHNHLNDINYKMFPYKAEKRNIIPYNEIERKLIMDNIGDDLYAQAIKLDFCMTIRIGEIKALKWSDIKGDYIYVNSFIDYKNNIINHCKGYADAGMRYLPLTKACKKILEEVKLINPDSEYLFIKDGKPLATCTFNRRLMKCCAELGIEYRSSHKIRYSTASILHKEGIEDTELQSMLGHTTLTMTNHYLKNVTPSKETFKKLDSILD
ncbi:MAG: tyrosine-type recombinase/integrase [Parabacteroides sp.]|nr:tyrosine-type recombinase/integrase [Parabacteroides sp.]